MTGERASMDHAVVRLRHPSGGVVGGGFLIGAGLVATCAHVVARATDGDETAPGPPAGPVLLDFPLVGGATATATVTRWVPRCQDETGDVAVLRIDGTAPPGATAARLAAGDGLWDEGVRILGFPTGHEPGVWVSGRLRGRQATGWVQFEAVHGPRVSGGFSGAPVWGEDSGGVLGLVVAAGRGVGTAYLVPLDAILSDELLAEVLPPCPYRGLDAFGERDADVFRGRLRETLRLAEQVAHRRLTAVSGRSGSGKSSLVRAGLLPRLRETGTTIIEVTPSPQAPRRQLVRAIGRVLDEEGEAVDGLAPAELGAALAERHDRVVLFVDQFEEIAAADPPAARDLLTMLDELVSAVRSRPGRPPAVQAVLTIRSTEAEAVFTADHAEVLDEGTVHVLPMGRDELRAAIVEPVQRAGLVGFEPGLVDRIVADALDAPGQLPLVQFALTRLWERQRGGLLTHEAYGAVGEVAGAIAAYAESVLARELVGAAERDLARQTLVRLARPGDGGSFVLAPVRLEELGPAALQLADRLARHRLLVIRHDPGQPPVVTLAHEALVEQWPTLHGWLVADREFLAWHARLRANLEEWQASREDAGALLRGGPLTEAETWAAGRSAALTDEERRYIGTSRAVARRGVRRWRAVTVVVAVLALVAGGLAVLERRSRDQIAADLRRQAAQQLATQSSVRRDVDTMPSLQFAQAAYAHDPSNLEARAAVLTQQARFGGLEWMHPLPGWPSFKFAEVDVDGSVAAVSDDHDVVTVWTGLSGPSPRSWRVTGGRKVARLRVSANGARMVVVGADGTVESWDVRGRHGPVPLRLPSPGGTRPADVIMSVGLSPNGRTTVLTTVPSGEYGADQGAVLAFDTASGQLLAHAPGTSAGLRVRRVADEGPKVWFGEVDGTGWPLRTVVMDLAARAELHTLPAGSVAADGSVVACDAATPDARTGYASVIDGGTGAVRRRIRIPHVCQTPLVDRSGRYLIADHGDCGPGSSGLAGIVGIVEVETGAAYQIRFPCNKSRENAFDAARSPTQQSSNVVIVQRAGGPALLLLDGGGVVVRSRPAEAVVDLVALDYPSPYSTGGAVFDSRGTWAAMAVTDTGRPPSDPDGQVVDVFALPSLRRAARLPGIPRESEAYPPTPAARVTSDDRFLLVVSPGDSAVVVVSTTDFTVRCRIPLLVPDALRGRLKPVGTAVLPLPGDRAAVVHGGQITQWRLTACERIGDPLPLTTDPGDAYRGVKGASAVPGNADEVILLIRDRVERWNLASRRRIRSYVPEPGTDLRSGAIGPTGHLVVLSGSSHLYRWDPGTGRQVGDRSTAAPDLSIVGFGPDGVLVLQDASGQSVTLWDTRADRAMGTIPIGGGSQASVAIVGNRAVRIGGHGLIGVDLAIDMAALCAVVDRPYTAGEKRLLPVGADRRPPCHLPPG